MQDIDGKRGNWYQDENDDLRFAGLVITFTIVCGLVFAGIGFLISKLF